MKGVYKKRKKENMLDGKISKDFLLVQNETKMSFLTTPIQYCPGDLSQYYKAKNTFVHLYISIFMYIHMCK